MTAAATVEPHVVAIHGRGAANTAAPLRIELRIPTDLRYFDGHFPECELLPGVVQIHWALQFGRRHFDLPPRVTQLANVKFMRIIAPGSPAELELDFQQARGELRFAYRVGAFTCSSGAIGLAT